MLCDKCGLDMRVVSGRNVITGDKSPDEATKLYTVLTLECRNKQCTAYKKQIEISNEQPVAKETTEEVTTEETTIEEVTTEQSGE